MSFTDNLRNGGESAPLTLVASQLPHSMVSDIVAARCADNHAHRALLIRSRSGCGVVLYCNDQWLVADVQPMHAQRGLQGSTLQGFRFLRLADSAASPDEVAALLAVSEVHIESESRRHNSATIESYRAQREQEREWRKVAVLKQLHVNRRWVVATALVAVALTIFAIGLRTMPDLLPERVAVVVELAFFAWLGFLLAVCIRWKLRRTSKRLAREES